MEYVADEAGVGDGLGGTHELTSFGLCALRWIGVSAGQRCDEPLGVECGGAARAGCRDRLPVRVVDQVAGGEDARHAGAGARLVDDDVPVAVQLDLADEEFAARLVSDRHEHAAHVEHLRLAGVHVADPEAGDLAVVAQDLLDDTVPLDADLRVRQGALSHDLAGPELVAAMDDRHGLGEPGEERGLLHRGVTAADHGDVLTTEEEAVTGGT